MRNILFVVNYPTRGVHEVGQRAYLCCGSAGHGSDFDHNDFLATSTCCRYKPERRKSNKDSVVIYLPITSNRTDPVFSKCKVYTIFREHTTLCSKNYTIQKIVVKATIVYYKNNIRLHKILHVSTRRGHHQRVVFYKGKYCFSKKYSCVEQICFYYLKSLSLNLNAPSYLLILKYSCR